MMNSTTARATVQKERMARKIRIEVALTIILALAAVLLTL
jgi:hypothetical protein